MALIRIVAYAKDKDLSSMAQSALAKEISMQEQSQRQKGTFNCSLRTGLFPSKKTQTNKTSPKSKNWKKILETPTICLVIN